MNKIKLTYLLILSLMLYEYSGFSQKRTDLPLIDISGQKERQIVIAEGTEKIYHGHPTTVLLPDGKTIFCVWSLGHGGKCGPMAKSMDGGKTWQMFQCPSDFSVMENCPSIYLLREKSGEERLIIFASRPEMAQTYSEDNGESWTSVRSLGIPCVMPFTTITRLKDGNYIGLYNRRPVGVSDPLPRPKPNEIWQSVSKDGGMTWLESRRVGYLEGHVPCEPAVIRSPDGNQLLCIARNNNRGKHSLKMTSDNEGEAWSTLTETIWGITGDRHIARYAPDGRLVIAFRDKAPDSPTKNHFVIWVGNYEDIINGRSGQYRVKLLHSYGGGDCGYSGLELLSDSTFVATTYIKYRTGPEKNSIISVRFKLNELDRLLITNAN